MGLTKSLIAVKNSKCDEVSVPSWRNKQNIVACSLDEEYEIRFGIYVLKTMLNTITIIRCNMVVYFYN
jgi:hypothetical protein